MLPPLHYRHAARGLFADGSTPASSLHRITSDAPQHQSTKPIHWEPARPQACGKDTNTHEASLGCRRFAARRTKRCEWGRRVRTARGLASSPAQHLRTKRAHACHSPSRVMHTERSTMCLVQGIVDRHATRTRACCTLPSVGAQAFCPTSSSPRGCSPKKTLCA